MPIRFLTLFASLTLLLAAQTPAPKPTPSAAKRAASATPAAAGAPNDVDAIIELVKSGMPENLVVKSIQKSGKSYNLAPADMLRLRKAGVGNAVIEAMIDSSGAPTSAPSASPGKPGRRRRIQLRPRLPAIVSPPEKKCTPRSRQASTTPIST
jgi:hypothetical protein